MSSFPEPSKYSELRARTDRQLIALADSALDRGLRAARWRCSDAERHRAEAIDLIAMVYELSPADRRRLETKMRELRELLHSCAEQRVRTAGA